MDEDLDQLTKDRLISEVKRLRAAIRKHRDNTGHNLCWYHPELWNLVPERVTPAIGVPDWRQFLRGCLRYRESLDNEFLQAPRTSGEYCG